MDNMAERDLSVEEYLHEKDLSKVEQCALRRLDRSIKDFGFSWTELKRNSWIVVLENCHYQHEAMLKRAYKVASKYRED